VFLERGSTIWTLIEMFETDLFEKGKFRQFLDCRILVFVIISFNRQVVMLGYKEKENIKKNTEVRKK
jgi:hypothetical protein